MPADDDWLGSAERALVARLRIDRRRADWRLGRWAAKAAVGARLGVEAGRLQVLAAPDGAPEAWLDGVRAPVSVSLSHRAGRALAVVADAPAVVGCDLELVEPRSDAFVRAWLAPAEQEHVSRCTADERARRANLLWSGKEAAAKVRREGLRLDVRRAVVDVDEAAPAVDGWRPLHVGWRAPASGIEVLRIAGWWRSEPEWCMVVCGEPCPAPPVVLAEEATCRCRM